MLLIHTFMGLAMAAGTVIVGLVVLRPSPQCLISLQYLCQATLYGIGNNHNNITISVLTSNFNFFPHHFRFSVVVVQVCHCWRWPRSTVTTATSSSPGSTDSAWAATSTPSTSTRWTGSVPGNSPEDGASSWPSAPCQLSSASP